jgi:hypothetical protein
MAALRAHAPSYSSRRRESRSQRHCLHHANLNAANLDRANLSGASLDFAALRGASLRYANLSGDGLHFANLTDATFEPSSVEGVQGMEPATGLFTLRFSGSGPTALVLVRDDFRKRAWMIRRVS